MTPAQIIESYVNDVVRNLPAWKREDVALELSELLTESLHARAEESGSIPSEDAALALVRKFGRPTEVAARYHPPFTLIEPTDTRSFVLACIMGSIFIVLLGLPKAIANPADNNIAVLWWTGLMVIVFAIKGFVDRSGMERRPWKPRAQRFHYDPTRASRAGSLFTMVVTLAALAFYCWPGPIVEFLSGGRVDRSLLAYSHSFVHGWRMIWLALVLAAYAILYGVVLVDGRWRAVTRFLDIALTFHIAWQLGWHFSYGDVFVSPQAEAALKPFANIFSLALFITMGVKIFLDWGRWPWRKPKRPRSA